MSAGYQARHGAMFTKIIPEYGQGREYETMVLKQSAVNVVLGLFLSLSYAGSVLAAPVSYKPPIAIPAGAGTDGPEFIAKGELNGDGNVDLVSVDRSAQTVSILLSDGAGGFTVSSAPIGVDARSVAIGDLDGDGDNDLVVANADTPGIGSVTVLLNNGSGVFSEAPGSPIDIEALAGANARPYSVTIAQINSTTDSFLDIAVSCDITNNVQILHGVGNGTFTPGALIAVGTRPISIASGSVNTATDSLTDLVVGNYMSNTVSVLLGDGFGGFTLVDGGSGYTFNSGGRPFSVKIASIDSSVDALPDIVLVNFVANQSKVRVYKGVGDGTFVARPMTSVIVAGRPRSVDAADVNADGILDLTTASDNTSTTVTDPAAAVTVLLGLGDGTFPTVAQFPLSGSPNSVVTANLDNDNQIDLAVANGTNNSVDVLLSAPTANAPVASDNTLALDEDVATNGTLTATDGDGALLNYSIVTNGTKGTAVITDAATGAYTYTPNANESGGDTFTFKANDGTADSNTATITVTIAAVNDAPTISGSPATKVVQNTAYSFTPGGGDVDGDTLTYSITNKPTWASFSTTTGALTGTPTNANFGTTTAGIVISVSDGIAAPVSLAAFNLKVVGVVNVTASDATATEAGRTTGRFTFTRTGSTAAALTVNYIVGGTARAGRDYLSLGGRITFPIGVRTVTRTVTPIDDTLQELKESVILSLSQSPNYAVGSARRASVIITSNETVTRVITVAASDATATEAGRTTGRFTFSRTGSTAAALTVNYSVGGTATAGSDYVSLGNRITFPIGARTVTRIVTPINDTLQELNETVILHLSQSPNYAVGRMATVTVISND